MSYTYRGTIRDLDEPVLITEPGVLDPEKCGTYAGYKRHQKNNDPPCEGCKGACADYSRDYYARRKSDHYTRVKGFDPSACGTYAGYKRHKRYGVAPCDACRAANREYMATLRANPRKE